MQALSLPSKRLADKAPLAAASIAYTVLSLTLLPRYLSFYYKDEISYVAAAERYARGDFLAAPNSLWGPLISWLVAIPLRLGETPILSGRLVCLLIGLAALWSTDRLARTLALPAWARATYLVTLVPYITHYALFGVTDDLALTGLLLVYFSIIFDPDYATRRYAGLICGILGAVAYYAKGFAFGFFLVHLSAATLIHAWVQPSAWRGLGRHFAVAITVFAVMASIWVGALYRKYGEVTLGITGQYNHQIVGPDAIDRPTQVIGFVAPPPVTTVSIWEDPAYFYRLPRARQCCLKPWSPFDSARAFRRQIELVRLNVKRVVLVFFGYSPLTFLIGLGAMAWSAPLLWRGRFGRRQAMAPEERRRRTVIPLATMTICLYPIPYMLVFADERFFWPVLVVLLGLGLMAVDRLATRYAPGVVARGCVVALFAATFLAFPIRQLAASHDAREATASFAEQLVHSPVAHSRFASNTDYGAAVCVGYRIAAKYYGQAAPDMSDDDVAKILRHEHVPFYLVWDEPPVRRPGMTLERALRAGHRTLAVYRVS